MPTSVRTFAHTDGGAIAIVFALVLLPILGAVGLAIDGMLLHRAKSALQASLDEATLAAARTYLVSGQESAARSTGEHFFATGKASTAMSGQIQSLTFANGGVTATATLPFKTSFMSIFGFNDLSIEATSEATGGLLDNVEIALMLDLSSSMTGWKFSELKQASVSFTNIVMADTQTKVARLALAPFAGGVNVGAYYSQVTGTSGTPANRCVTTRPGAQELTDAPPQAGSYFMGLYEGNGWECPINPVLPLTASRSTVQTEINDLRLSSGTEGQFGTMWAWYLLSPSWSSLWPPSSQPVNYGSVRTRKIAVLMTDGENFSQAFATDEQADQRAKDICTAMKAQGITIYSVGFEVDAARARDVLGSCASSQRRVYFPSGEGSLTATFQQIAVDLMGLRLVQ